MEQFGNYTSRRNEPSLTPQHVKKIVAVVFRITI